MTRAPLLAPLGTRHSALGTTPTSRIPYASPMIANVGIIAIFLAIGFVVALLDVARGRGELFDERLSGEDRQRLTRLAIFVLLPMTVLAHEGGHALAVKAYGGEV